MKVGTVAPEQRARVCAASPGRFRCFSPPDSLVWKRREVVDLLTRVLGKPFQLIRTGLCLDPTPKRAGPGGQTRLRRHIVHTKKSTLILGNPLASPPCVGRVLEAQAFPLRQKCGRHQYFTSKPSSDDGGALNEGEKAHLL